MHYCLDCITDVLLVRLYYWCIAVRLYYWCITGSTVLLMYYWFDCITDVLMV